MRLNLRNHFADGTRALFVLQAFVIGSVLAASASVAHVGLAAVPQQAVSLDEATIFLLRFDENRVVAEGPPEGSFYAEFVNPRPAYPDAKLVAGRFGKAFDCTANPSLHLHVGSADQPVDEFAVDFWLFADAGTSTEVEVVYEFPGMHRLRAKRGETLQLLWDVRVDGDWHTVESTAPMEAWTHVGAVFDGKTAELWVDGESPAAVAAPGVIRRLNLWNRTASLGGNCLGQQRFHGKVDEYRFSKGARRDFSAGLPQRAATARATVKPLPRIHLKDRDKENRPVRLFSSLSVPLAVTAPVIDGHGDDSVWRQITGTWFLETGIQFSVDAGNREAFATVCFKLTYDDTNLYLMARVFEGSDQWLKPKSPNIWDSNALELFMQPGGALAPYIQVALSPHGDVWSKRYVPLPDRESPHDRTEEPLPLPGLRLGTSQSHDSWTVEVAIPFGDLGVASPTPNTTWRGNVAYASREPFALPHSWAFVWPLFYWDYRFGRFDFTGEAEALTSTITLKGRLVDESGVPIAWGNEKLAALDVGGRAVRTNSQGEFTIPGLHPGRLSMRSLVSTHNPVEVTVDLKKPIEILEPIVLQSTNFYASGLPLGEHEVSLFTTSVETPPELPVAPGSLAPARQIDFLLPAGERGSAAVAVVANRDLSDPRVVIDASLIGDAGEIDIKADAARWTRRLLVRDNDNVTPEESSIVWRFLDADAPAMIAAGDLRHVVLSMRVPENTPPGRYKGIVRLFSGDREITRLPVAVHVPAFSLATPAEKFVGFYYYTKVRGKPLSDAELLRDYRGMISLGASQVFMSDVDFQPTADDPYAEIKRQIRLQQQAGFRRRFNVYTHPVSGALLLSDAPADQATFRRLIEGLDEVERELGLEPNTIFVSYGDEVWGEAFWRWAEWSKRLKAFSSRPNYMTLTYSKRVADQRQFQMMLPLLDIANHNGTPEFWGVIRDGLMKNNVTGWFYPNTVHDTLYARIANGFYLWASPFEASVPWTFYFSGGNEFFDSMRARHTIFAYQVPDPNNPGLLITTLVGEAYRAGYDDLRYLATLEDALAKSPAETQKSEAFARATALLESFRQRPTIGRVYGEPMPYTAAGLHTYRRQIAYAIEALQPASAVK